jgi:Holliday junction resolvase RusA-like endonuclease
MKNKFCYHWDVADIDNLVKSSSDTFTLNIPIGDTTLVWQTFIVKFYQPFFFAIEENPDS